MNLIIKINLDNAAFEEDPEGALEHIFEQVYNNRPSPPYGPCSWSLIDREGNKVGTVEVNNAIN